MNKKICFFDIDGTLWDAKGTIPVSTISAIRQLHKNGHLAFINTGRTRAFVHSEDLLGIGFDGIVAGCGTQIEYNGEFIFYKKIEDELAIKTVETVKKYGLKPILEGKDYLYFDNEDFGDDPYGKFIKSDMGDNLLSIKNNWGKWEFSKLSCATKSDHTQECFDELSPYYHFLVHNPEVAEFVPLGFTKGTGIQKICELFDTDIADTYAFGDSVNDIDMLKIAGTSIVMGNGTDVAKKEADFITTDILEDGIFNACKHFELI